MKFADGHGNSLSAFMPAYKNSRAVFEALKSFRVHYPTAPITVVSDGGDDFTKICCAFNAKFILAPVRTVLGPEDQRTNSQSTIDGIQEYFGRLYRHCISTDAEWVFDLETDVRTIRPIRSFPATDCAGPRLNPFSPELTDHLIRSFGYKNYGYGMSGGSIWRTKSFIKAYETNRNLGEYVEYDDRVSRYGDIALTLLFWINGFEYSVWDEVSEIFHDVAPIIRDSAFDHAYKYWYDKPFDDSLLNELESSR